MFAQAISSTNRPATCKINKACRCVPISRVCRSGNAIRETPETSGFSRATTNTRDGFDVARARHSAKSAPAMPGLKCSGFDAVIASENETIRSAFGYRRGRSRTVLTTLKTA